MCETNRHSDGSHHQPGRRRGLKRSTAATFLLIVVGAVWFFVWPVGSDLTWLWAALGWLEGGAWAVFGFLVAYLFAFAEDVGLL